MDRVAVGPARAAAGVAAPATASATPLTHVSAAAANGAISTTVSNPPTLIGTRSGICSRIAISSDRRRYSA
ncbi:hypothetical protein KI388_12680 [Halorubrum sp. 2020YC2]|nr:hypothetical protein KI388_12680 [Halorubrum sp. 2020YC2]